jgi:hypothetical protein
MVRASVEREPRSVDPSVSVENVRTLEQIRDESLSSRNLRIPDESLRPTKPVVFAGCSSEGDPGRLSPAALLETRQEEQVGSPYGGTARQ